MRFINATNYINRSIAQKYELMRKTILLFSLLMVINNLALAQEDTTKNELYGWQLVDGFLIEPYEFDTIINDFQAYNPVEKYSISNNWLGNLGSAWQSNIYFGLHEEDSEDFIFDKYYKPYVFSKENQVFYHSKTPFFNIHWTTSSRSRNENQLYALYTQNINEKWNVGMRYKLIASEGEFANSKTSEHSMNPFLSYTGERYSLHAGLIRNKFKTFENGGINHLNPDETLIEPEFAQPLITTASSVYYDRSFFLSQEYKFGFTKKIVINDSTTESTFREFGRINHVLSYDDNYRVFADSEPIQMAVSEDGVQTGYYDTIFYLLDEKSETRDSIRYAKFENSLYWTFKEIKRPNFNGRLTVGGTLENIKWVNTVLKPTLDSVDIEEEVEYYSMADTALNETFYNNVKLSASLDARTKMFIFNASAYYYLTELIGLSSRAGNFGGTLLVSKGIIIAKRQSDFYFKLKLRKNSPYVFQEKYQSNHYAWRNTFSDINEQEIRAGLVIPSIRMKGEFATKLTTNYIYCDSNALFRQAGEVLNVTSVRLHKDFKLGRFFIKNKVIYQLPPNLSDDVISLPEWSFYNTTYFDLDHFLDKISVEAHLGFDVIYYSKFKALGYNPAVGQFYQSNSGVYTGEYPIVNLFLNMRIKTVLLFFKYENLVNLFSQDKYYFILDKYSMNTAAFRFGVSWRFKS